MAIVMNIGSASIHSLTNQMDLATKLTSLANDLLHNIGELSKGSVITLSEFIGGSAAFLQEINEEKVSIMEEIKAINYEVLDQNKVNSYGDDRQKQIYINTVSQNNAKKMKLVDEKNAQLTRLRSVGDKITSVTNYIQSTRSELASLLSNVLHLFETLNTTICKWGL